jgi:WD40 repeat protein
MTSNSTTLITGDLTASSGGSINIAGGNIGFSAEQVQNLLAQLREQFQPKPYTGLCPYLGLNAFREQNSAFYFGRENQIHDLLERLRIASFIMVAGASGSGKSSLVRAGVLAQLKAGALPGSQNWLYDSLSPGRQPLEQLALSVGRMGKSPQAADYLRQQISQPDALLKTILSLLSDDPAQRAVLFIDQFEEIFTQLSEERQAERNTFLANITMAASRPDSRIIILTAMRSDFLLACAPYADLNRLLNQQFYQVGAMQPDELVRAIALPAYEAGLRIDPDLVTQIVKDMGNEPGALPLMQFALRDLFDAQVTAGGVPALTLADYLARGGLHKALQRHADAQFSLLQPAEQALAEQIFAGLVEPGQGAQDTRRTARLSELTPAGADPQALRSLVNRLADARLITTTEDDQEPTITIAHERLLDAWPWLRRLVDENRERFILRNRLSSDALTWADQNRDPSYLYHGARLLAAEEELSSHPAGLNQISLEFVRAGAQERDAARRRRERQVRLIIGTAAVVALVMAFLAFWGWNNANVANQQAVIANEQRSTATFALGESQVLGTQAAEQADLAQQQAEFASQQAAIAQARLLGSQALALVDPEKSFNVDPYLALLLSREAILLAPDHANDARMALQISLDYVNLKPNILNQDNFIVGLDFSPDGRWLATGSSSSVKIWDLQSQAMSQNINLSPYQVYQHEGDAITTLLFSPDGRWLVAGGYDPSLLVWDVNSNEAAPLNLPSGQGYVTGMAFSPDNRTLFISRFNNPVVEVWNLQDLQSGFTELRGTESSFETRLAVSPDGRWLATANNCELVCLYDLKNSDLEPQVLKGGVNVVTSLVFSPDSQQLAAGFYLPFDDTTGASAATLVWNLADPLEVPLELIGDPSGNLTMAYSPDGKYLATGGFEYRIFLWNLETTPIEPTLLLGHENTIDSLHFSGDGGWLASASGDKTVRLWNMNNLQTVPVILREVDGNPTTLAFNPDGRYLGTSFYGGNYVRLWPVNWDELVEEVCQIARRNFSQDEWTQYFPGQPYRKTCPQWQPGL